MVRSAKRTQRLTTLLCIGGVLAARKQPTAGRRRAVELLEMRPVIETEAQHGDS